MSKHSKPYHNYNNYSANKSAVEPTEVVENEEMKAVAEASPAAGLRADISPVDEAATIETVEPAIEEPVVETTELATGIVNCAKLRVRASASTESAVICEIKNGDEVKVNEAESSTDFYAVTTTAGIEGYCMKKFVTIK